MSPLSTTLAGSFALLLSALSVPAQAGVTYDFEGTVTNVGGFTTDMYQSTQLSFTFAGTFELPETPGAALITLVSVSTFSIFGTDFDTSNVYAAGRSIDVGGGEYDTTFTLGSAENGAYPEESKDGFLLTFALTGLEGLFAEPSSFTLPVFSAEVRGQFSDYSEYVGLDSGLTGTGAITFTRAEVSAVPLPAAAPLLVAALGGLGALGVRRRRRA